MRIAKSAEVNRLQFRRRAASGATATMMALPYLAATATSTFVSNIGYALSWPFLWLWGNTLAVLSYLLGTSAASIFLLAVAVYAAELVALYLVIRFAAGRISNWLPAAAQSAAVMIGDGGVKAAKDLDDELWENFATLWTKVKFYGIGWHDSRYTILCISSDPVSLHTRWRLVVILPRTRAGRPILGNSSPEEYREALEHSNTSDVVRKKITRVTRKTLFVLGCGGGQGTGWLTSWYPELLVNNWACPEWAIAVASRDNLEPKKMENARWGATELVGSEKRHQYPCYSSNLVIVFDYRLLNESQVDADIGAFGAAYLAEGTVKQALSGIASDNTLNVALSLPHSFVAIYRPEKTMNLHPNKSYGDAKAAAVDTREKIEEVALGKARMSIHLKPTTKIDFKGLTMGLAVEDYEDKDSSARVLKIVKGFFDELGTTVMPMIVPTKRRSPSRVFVVIPLDDAGVATTHLGGLIQELSPAAISIMNHPRFSRKGANNEKGGNGA